MNKIYKLGNKEIEKLELNHPTDYNNAKLESKINEILEALADKEEKLECTEGTYVKDWGKKEECDWQSDGTNTERCSKCNKWKYGYEKQITPCQPKQEEWTDCILCARDKGHIMGNPKVFEGIEHTCTLKQSTSLKEEVRKLVKECVYVGELSSEKISDKILSLIQFYLVKEVEQVEPTQYVKRDSELNQTYTQAKLDIIKIINNINI